MDMEGILLLVALAGLIAFLVLLFRWIRGRAKKTSEAGYEQIGTTLTGTFWARDDEFFYLSGMNLNNITPIEITGVSAIRKNTRLVQLEIRFRMDGIIQSKRISGSTNQLLSIEDKLGYSI